MAILKNNSLVFGDSSSVLKTGRPGLTDCNTMLSEGTYSAYSPDNAPSTGWGLLIVLSVMGDTHIAQFWIDTWTCKIYFRTSDGGSFRSWKEL